MVTTRTGAELADRAGRKPRTARTPRFFPGFSNRSLERSLTSPTRGWRDGGDELAETGGLRRPGLPAERPVAAGGRVADPPPGPVLPVAGPRGGDLPLRPPPRLRGGPQRDRGWPGRHLRLPRHDRRSAPAVHVGHGRPRP